MPKDSSVLVALEKDNLIAVAEQSKQSHCNAKTLVQSNPALYMEMDDKSQAAWRQLPPSDVQFNEIPTLSMMMASEPEVKRFIQEDVTSQRVMLKPCDEAASVGQVVVP